MIGNEKEKERGIGTVRVGEKLRGRKEHFTEWSRQEPLPLSQIDCWSFRVETLTIVDQIILFDSIIVKFYLRIFLFQ